MNIEQAKEYLDNLNEKADKHATALSNGYPYETFTKNNLNPPAKINQDDEIKFQLYHKGRLAMCLEEAEVILAYFGNVLEIEINHNHDPRGNAISYKEIE